MPPKVYECVYVGGRSQEEVVSPLIIANVQAAVLVHPADKSHDIQDRRPKWACAIWTSSTHQARNGSLKKSMVLTTVSNLHKIDSRF